MSQRGKPKLILSHSGACPVPTAVPNTPSVVVNPLPHPQADPCVGLDVFLIAHGFYVQTKSSFMSL